MCFGFLASDNGLSLIRICFGKDVHFWTKITNVWRFLNLFFSPQIIWCTYKPLQKNDKHIKMAFLWNSVHVNSKSRLLDVLIFLSSTFKIFLNFKLLSKQRRQFFTILIIMYYFEKNGCVRLWHTEMLKQGKYIWDSLRSTVCFECHSAWCWKVRLFLSQTIQCNIDKQEPICIWQLPTHTLKWVGVNQPYEHS